MTGNFGSVLESLERSVVVAAPIAQAFEPWLDVEGWPKFLKAIRSVQRVDERQFLFCSERGGQEYESLAEITLVIPEKRIAWRTVSGAINSGVVCFEPQSDVTTRVHLKMQHEPDAGWNAPSALAQRLEFHLACFKEFIEAPRGDEAATSGLNRTDGLSSVKAPAPIAI